MKLLTLLMLLILRRLRPLNNLEIIPMIDLTVGLLILLAYCVIAALFRKFRGGQFLPAPQEIDGESEPQSLQQVARRRMQEKHIKRIQRDNDIEQRQHERSLARREKYGWIVISAGKIFRYLFIAALMFMIPQFSPSIGDTPFSSLTPNDLLRGIFCVGLEIGCLMWMFRQPTDSAAEGWAGLACLFILAALGLLYYGLKIGF